MNPKLDQIFKRRSVRKYQDRAVPDEMIKDILQAGMAAPSACCKDPWRFVVTRDRTLLGKIADGLPNGQMLRAAGAGIVVCVDMDLAHDGQISYALQDCSAAIENILLAAGILGLGACWLGVHPREERMEHIRKLIGIAGNVIPVSVLSIGWPAEVPVARTRYDEGKITFL